MTVSKFIKLGDTSELDSLIYSQSIRDPEADPALQLRKQNLGRKYHEDLLDVNGLEGRQQTKKMLDDLLDQIVGVIREAPGSDVVPNLPLPSHSMLTSQATPDTSHFQMDLDPHFQTPNVQDHVRNHDNASLTPSNLTSHRASRPSPSISASRPVPQGIQPTSHPPGSPPLMSSDFGFYVNLMYCSSYLSRVFAKMFERVGKEKPVQVCEGKQGLSLQHTTSSTRKNLFCSRDVDEVMISSKHP